MKYFGIIIGFILIAFIFYDDSNDFPKITTADRIKNHGYSSEIHNVTTKDGYILQLFRIKTKTHQANETQAKPVVLMMHGFMISSDCWVIGDPGNILSFWLVDNGYDIWLGNARGNPYSMNHLHMQPDEKQFWRFSIHEIGVIDMPATIDYILNATQQSSLHYVGHSQGSMVMLILISSRPDYNAKLKTSHLLAPVAFMKNALSPVVRWAGPLTGPYMSWFVDHLIGDADLASPWAKKLFGFNMCRSGIASKKYCAALLFVVGGVSAYMNESLIPEVLQAFPASCSYHQGVHLVQLHVSGHFRRYDYGVNGNLARYGQPTPPDYELENINPRFPLHLYYSAYDALNAVEDVEKLSSLLGNRSVKEFIDLKHFTHIDFLIASNAKEVLYVTVLERMNEVEEILAKEKKSVELKSWEEI